MFDNAFQSIEKVLRCVLYSRSVEGGFANQAQNIDAGFAKPTLYITIYARVFFLFNFLVDAIKPNVENRLN